MSWKKWFNKKETALKRFQAVESTVYEIFAPNNRYIGRQFFQHIAPRLCELTGANYVLIGKYLKNTNQVSTLVFANGKLLKENFIYDLSDSPCERVIGKKTCSFPKSVAQLFPKDRALAKNGVEGYIGVPLFNSSYEPNGILVALFKKPLNKKLVKTIESLMYLYTARMSTEIEHLSAKDEVEKRNIELELMHRALKEKNKKLDDSLSELNRIQLKSQEYDQLKSTFLANLSHELRTPMNVILGFLELLRSEELSSEEREEYINIINVNGLQLLKVMDNLIDISKLQTRLLQEGPSRFSLKDLMTQLLIHYRNEANTLQKNVRIEFTEESVEKVKEVFTDQDALLKVLNHLLDNALKFTSTGDISFGCTYEADYLHFYVKDTGIGVPEGKESVIFDMFRQVSTSYNPEFGGNGLGLAISKKYIDTLGGQIWLDKNYTKGACFRFTIPYEVVRVKSVVPNAALD